jgi:hypothetical protein
VTLKFADIKTSFVERYEDPISVITIRFKGAWEKFYHIEVIAGSPFLIENKRGELKDFLSGRIRRCYAIRERRSSCGEAGAWNRSMMTWGTAK